MTADETMADLMARRRRITPGERVLIELPHSEVCMHMQVAGKVMGVEVVTNAYNGVTFVMAQLWDMDGHKFSAPIGIGEAGIYGCMSHGMYCYPVREG